MDRDIERPRWRYIELYPGIVTFARGMAFANTIKITDAENERSTKQNKMREPSLKEPLAPFNSVYAAALVDDNILPGTTAENKKNLAKAISLFKNGCAV